MVFDHVLILAIIQGVTEFLPVSSSAHLALVPVFTDWPDQGRRIDVAVHVGSLLAVLVYCCRDVVAMLRGGVHVLIGRASADRRLVLSIFVASLPLVIVGLLVHLYLPAFSLRDPRVIAWASIGFGILLYIADRGFLVVKKVEHMTMGDALVIGLSQALALIPGSSRAGVTITASRVLGYERREAARFSILLSIPAILGAGSLIARDLYHMADWTLTQDAMMAALFSFVAAFVSIFLMMAWLRRSSFTPFIMYRIGLGVAVLWFLGDFNLGDFNLGWL